MIQAILTYQFVLNPKETGEIEPEFSPIQLVFKNDQFNRENYSDLIIQNDIFAIFYQHTTGVVGETGAYGNFYTGRLKESPYQVISYFRQEADRSQFLTISVFELDDEIEIFDELIKALARKMDVTYETLIRAKSSKQLSLIEKVHNRLAEDIKFTLFQVERFSNLDKLQKAALIFNSEERLKILTTLREYPISKREMKNLLEKIKPNPNVDILLEPFLELNLIRRDWIKGERDKRTGKIENQGEYLFLTKDIILARVPNETLLNKLKETESKGKVNKYVNYRKLIVDFFSVYDPMTETVEEKKKMASILLNPDIFDFFQLMRSNFYPLDKIPKILSNWADVDMILDELRNLNIITEVKDEENRSWVMLLTDLKPLIIFPEYLLPKIKTAYDTNYITQEIAKKAFDLLEVSFPESVEF
jgi:hypothetical protein